MGEFSKFLTHSRLRLGYAITVKSLAQEVICTLSIHPGAVFTEEKLYNYFSLVDFKEAIIAFLLECSACEVLCYPEISTQSLHLPN